MDKSVCILLNEREPHKKEASSALQAILYKQGFTPVVLEVLPVPDLITEIKSMNAFALVVDYLLGDLLTGLDLLAAMQQDSLSVHSFMFTDDPSQAVVVDAFRLGLSDFFRIDSPGEAQKLSSALAACWYRQVAQTSHSVKRATPRRSSVSEKSRSFEKKLKSTFEKPLRAIVVHGERGTGKSSALAEYLHSQDIPFRMCDFYTGRVENITFYPERECYLLPDVIPQQTPFLVQHLNDRGTDVNGTPAPYLITTTFPQVVASLKALPGVDSVYCPSLGERGAEEMRATAMNLGMYVQELGVKGIPALGEEEMSFLIEQSWPTNFVQFQSVLMEAFIHAREKTCSLRESLEIAYNNYVLQEETSADTLRDKIRRTLTVSRAHANVHRGAALLGVPIDALATLLLEQEPQ